MKRFYTDEEIADLLCEANDMGYDLGKGSVLEKLTLAELEQIVNGQVQ